MRERWTRTTPYVQIGVDEATQLIRPALGDATITSIEPIRGGHSNTNLRAHLASAPHCVVLRLYQRDPGVAQKEAAIARLLSGKVPAPRFLYTGVHDGRTYAVVQFVSGETLAAAAKHASEAQLAAMGHSVGKTLAAIHSFTFATGGFLDGELNVTPFPAGLMLAPYLQTCFAGIAGERLGKDLARDVVAFAQRNENRLDVWSSPPRLTHFDFGGTNILVRNDGAVAGVVDWEFAAASNPSADFGNLLRPPLGAMPAFVGTVEESYRSAGGFLPGDWRALIRIADIGAWADFLTRDSVSDDVIADARRTLRETISSTSP